MMTTGADVMTTIHLAILAVLALLVIAGIVWGSRLRRRRREGMARRTEHQAEIDAAPTSNTAPRQMQAQDQFQTQRAAPAPETIAPPPSDWASPPEPSPSRDAATVEPTQAAAPIAAIPEDEATTGFMEGEPSAADQPVTILKGLGPKLATRLGELGITRVGDMAALDAAQAEALDAKLGAFTGRMARDRWIEQARLLAAGDRAGFEAAFGKL